MLDRVASSETGLADAEAARRLEAEGPNLIAQAHVTAFGILLAQLRNPLLLLLLAAAAVSGLTGDPTDAGIIAAIVAMSVGLSFFNEYRSAKAVAALHGDIHYQALVWRGGAQGQIDVTELVRGDVVALRVGGVVPADLRLIETNMLECDEAVLTGESMAAVKSVTPAPPSDSAVDLPPCAFMGTVVHQGSGRGVVVATGSATAFGKIAAGLGERQAETAFQAGLRGFSKLLVKVAGVLTVSIFVINVAFQRPLIEALLFSLAIAIGITPQLLPAIVSISLSSGSRALARKRVLVKRLVTIEDLGNIEVLFTDKTGTLTEGAITFARALDPGGERADTALAARIAVQRGDADRRRARSGATRSTSRSVAPAATPLLGAADGPPAFERLGPLPFDHERQLASVVVQTPEGKLDARHQGRARGGACPLRRGAAGERRDPRGAVRRRRPRRRRRDARLRGD